MSLTRTSDNLDSLSPVTIDVGIEEAIAEIELERSPLPNGLKTRWPIINKAMMRYFRFKNIYTLGGASGSAKSYWLGHARFDFTDMDEIRVPINKIAHWLLDYLSDNADFHIGSKYIMKYPINGNFPNKVLNLHFGYEMSQAAEILRTLSDYTKLSYQHLLSSDGKKNDDNTYTYARLSDDELTLLKLFASELTRTRVNNMFMFPEPGNLIQMYKTVEQAAERYPNHKLIVSIDHTLLSKRYEEKNDQELQDNTIRMLITIRNDFNAMVLPIIQMNSNIEASSRRENPALHYPIKSDLYMGGQFYQGSDFMMTMFQPLTIGIGRYGPRQLDTNGLIHYGLLKSRYSIPGQMWLINDLKRGGLLSAIPDLERKCLVPLTNGQMDVDNVPFIG